MDILLKALPSIATIAATVAFLFVVRHALERGAGPLSANATRSQLIMLGLSSLGVLVVLLVLPLGDTMRGQILSLIGILLSAAIALSATTFVGNAMAGVMLRSVRNFRTGDFVRCGAHFGRVSERGLFHIEIQTEDRDLTTLPNMFLVTNPVTTVRSSGTVVSATVSLGYDVARTKIEECLLGAAERAQLNDAFVHVTELGDFSVVYRVAGLLTEVKQLLTARARLRAAMLDALHEAEIEIVSPNFMNTRAVAEGAIFIPRKARIKQAEPDQGTSSPDDIIFDKADEAETLETLQFQHADVVARIEQLKETVAQSDEGPEREAAERDIETLLRRRERLEAVLVARESRSE